MSTRFRSWFALGRYRALGKPPDRPRLVLTRMSAGSSASSVSALMLHSQHCQATGLVISLAISLAISLVSCSAGGVRGHSQILSFTAAVRVQQDPLAFRTWQGEAVVATLIIWVSSVAPDSRKVFRPGQGCSAR